MKRSVLQICWWLKRMGRIAWHGHLPAKQIHSAAYSYGGIPLLLSAPGLVRPAAQMHCTSLWKFHGVSNQHIR
jgi:hypothetical protein